MHERGDKCSPRIKMGEGVRVTQCMSTNIIHHVEARGEPHQNSTKDLSQILEEVHS